MVFSMRKSMFSERKISSAKLKGSAFPAPSIFHQGDSTFRFLCRKACRLLPVPLRNDLCMSDDRASAFISTAKVFLRSNPIVDPKCSHATAQKCPFRHEAPPRGAAMMSGIFRFVFLVRRCPICVILHIYHHAVAQYHIENYGKHTADCTQKRICIASS